VATAPTSVLSVVAMVVEVEAVELDLLLGVLVRVLLRVLLLRVVAEVEDRVRVISRTEEVVKRPMVGDDVTANSVVIDEVVTTTT